MAFKWAHSAVVNTLCGPHAEGELIKIQYSCPCMLLTFLSIIQFTCSLNTQQFLSVKTNDHSKKQTNKQRICYATFQSHLFSYFREVYKWLIRSYTKYVCNFSLECFFWNHLFTTTSRDFAYSFLNIKRAWFSTLH